MECRPHPAIRGDHEPLGLQHPQGLPERGAPSAERACQVCLGDAAAGLKLAALDRRSQAGVQRGDALAVADLGCRHVQTHGCRDRRSVRQRYCARKVCTPVTILHGSDVSQSGYLASSFGPRVATISSAS